MRWGFVDINGSPKPQYTAMQSLLQTLSDPSRDFEPRSLPFSLSGETSNVHQLLLQKHDGTFFLLLWLEVPGWDASTQAALNVAPQHLRINLGVAPREAVDFSYAANWSFHERSLAASPSIDVPVSDAISIIELRP